MRKLWRTIPYLLVILVQLIQPIGSLANQSGAANLPGAAAYRSPWNRPSVQTMTMPDLQPLPRQIITFDTPPELLKNSADAPTALPAPFPLGNNNFGQAYKDTNNPEDHPGRHFAGPVNLINGNLFLTVGDFFIPDQGLSLQFARSYNSLDKTTDGPFGVGWTHSFNLTFEENMASTEATLREADGSLLKFTRPGPGMPWTPPLGVYRELMHMMPGDPYLLMYKNGLVMEFLPIPSPGTPKGRLNSITDRNGNRIQLTYDPGGNLINIAGPTGAQLNLVYADVMFPKHITSVIDTTGRTVNYAYIGDMLAGAAYPEGSSATYQYDMAISQMMIGYDDPRQPRGTAHGEIIYNATSQRVERMRYHVDSFFDVYYSPASTTWEDGMGITSVINYDANFNVIYDATWMGAAWVGENWLYGPDLMLNTKINADGFPTIFAYDGRGNLTQVTSALGGITKFRYEASYSNVISTTNPLGATILYKYDAHGNLQEENRPDGSHTMYTVDTAGNLTSITDNAGNATTYGYDAAGNLTSVTDANGNVTTHEYDALRRVTNTTDPLLRETSYAYDAADRLVEMTDPDGKKIQYTYDPHSNLLTITNANGKIYTHTYDALDRLLTVTDPLGFIVNYRYDGNSRLVQREDTSGVQTRYFYNNAGRLIKRTYASGQVDTFRYDNRGNMALAGNGVYTATMQYDSESRLIDVHLHSPAFTALPQIHYSYDPLGNRIQSVVADGVINYTTNYTYDSLNRLVQSVDSDGRHWTTTYNNVGRRATLTLPDSSHVEYVYDDFGNLTEQSHYDPLSVLLRSFTYDYDEVGNTKGETDNGLIYEYSYDPLNRLSAANTPGGNATFAYDAVGNLLTTNSASGTDIYAYDDANHRLSSSDTTYTYDSMGRRIQEVGPRGTIGYIYDAEMRLVRVNQPGGPVFLEYDALGQLLGIQEGASNTLLLRSKDRLEGELDSAGRLKRAYTIDTEIVAMKVFGGTPLIADFHYDGHGRVRWVTNAAGGATIAQYSDNPAEDYPGLYNPIRLQGTYFIPSIRLYLISEGQFWDPWSGLFLFRFRPWAFWPYGPFFSWWSIFHWWPWPWPWARPWGWAWPRPWPFWWPWPGVWVRTFLLWPFWPMPLQPFLPWWWYWHWWGWTPWAHWWWWHPWWWLRGWWFWGWWCGWCWWWPYWWWHWLWWWPCWWIWWVWWGWWGHWWWCWFWWWPWHWPWWGWWWPIYWLPVMPRPPDYGDAADPTYPSLLASNGARHLDTSYEWLGANASREYNARLTDIDTLDDGVTVNLLTGAVSFTVTTSGAFWRYSAARPIHVHGWFDWNRDGDWNDPGELVINWSGYPGAGGWPIGQTWYSVATTIAVPVSTHGPVWVRFRLDYAQNIELVTGPANFGEVEDYQVPIYRVKLPLILRPAP